MRIITRPTVVVLFFDSASCFDVVAGIFIEVVTLLSLLLTARAELICVGSV